MELSNSKFKMVYPEDFFKILKKNEPSSLSMVPCSIFKPLTKKLLENKVKLIFPPNEAHAIGFASGSYLATGKPAIIFLQNSGLNNIANAQTSLNLLYKIPVLLVISWRGEKKEAPEHDVTGKHLLDFLKLLQIPFEVLSENWQEQAGKMIDLTTKKKTPTALVIKQGFFEGTSGVTGVVRNNKYSLSRYRAIKMVKEIFNKKAVFLSNTGHISRDSLAVLPTSDFYMMGSMGHLFSIGAGVAWSLNSKTKTVVLDGDGGCLMHLGSLALMGLSQLKKSNLVYLVLDNEAYESTGSQPSLSSKVDLLKVAKALGFPQVFLVKNEKELKSVLGQIKDKQAAFVQVKVNLEKFDSPRVSDKIGCQQITDNFIKQVKKTR